MIDEDPVVIWLSYVVGLTLLSIAHIVFGMEAGEILVGLWGMSVGIPILGRRAK